MKVINKTSIIKVFIIALLSLNSCAKSDSSGSFYNLQVEDVSNPKGVQDQDVKFSWKYKTNDAQDQTHSEIEISTDKQFRHLAYNSGLVKNNKYFQKVRIKGLESNQNYYWRVRIKDNTNQLSSWSETNHFLTGIVNELEWQAKLIEGEGMAMVRKEFNLDKEVKTAYANVSTGGLYELHINGEKVGDRVLEPIQTNTHKRLIYATYDVTDLVQNGDNVVGAYLGGGAYGHLYKSYRRNVLIHINVTYEDGSTLVIATDETWKGYDDGPITYTGLYEGEKYDARKEVEGWQKPGFDETGWKELTEREAPKLYCQLQPIREIQVLKTISKKQLNGKTIYDLGQNIVGYVEIDVKGNPGDKIKIRTAELLNDDGTINNNSQRQRWYVEYILKGGDKEVWKPKFSNTGFRYIEIETEGHAYVNSVKGIHMHSDFEVNGEFTCSNKLINKIQKAYLWSQTGNSMGFPTDCPHRERLGWLGDALQIGVSSAYNYDMQYFWRKWFRDINDDIQPDGSVHQLIPFPNFGDEQDPVWQSASIIMPHELYYFYGDPKFIEERYFGMTRMMDYYQNLSSNYLIQKNRWGDWVRPHGDDWTNGEFLTSAYWYKCSVLMAEMAKVINQPEDAKKYKELAVKIRKAINDKYFHETHYDRNTQTANAIALDFGIVEEKNKEAVLTTLIKNIEDKDDHIAAGVVGQMPLVCALNSNGRDDKALKMVMQKSFPSLGYMIEKGATTLWEKYHYGTGTMDSHNHVFLGGPHAKWFYDGLAGIKPLKPGFKEILIQPNILLPEVSAKFDSPYGQIACEWKREGQKINMTIEVPFNTTALLHLPTDIFDLNLVNIKQNNEVIWSGKTDKSGDDIKFKTIENGKVVYELNPGSYVFELY